MGIVTVNEENLTNIANAIREKNQTDTTYKPSEMAGAIQEIKGGLPKKGFVVDEWSEYGYPTSITVIGMTEIPNKFFYQLFSYNANHSTYFLFGRASLNLPDNITTIGVDAFYECNKLTLNKLPNALVYIDTRAFSGCTELALTELPNDITHLGGNECFKNCSNLALIKLPDGLEGSLPSSAFSGCTKLALTELPSGISRISQWCFQSCTNLYNLTIKSTTLNGLDYGCFEKCSNLATIVIPNITSVPTLGSNVFDSTPIKKGTGFVYVPDTLVDSLKSSTNWSNFADQIKPISEMPIE